MRFIDKTVIVTGAGRGIGAQAARRFAQEGANVVIADIDAAAADRVARQLDNSLALEVDVTSLPAITAMVKSVQARFGRIDVLVNNAMVCADYPLLTASEEQVGREIAVNLVAPIFTTQSVLPTMISQGGGVILNVSSVNGLAYFGNEAYSAAKAGLINFSRSIAVQFGAQGIRCNAVAPGTIATETWNARLALNPEAMETLATWYPLKRVGTTDDVAESLMFLASDAAQWITGIVLPVDGGILAGNVAMLEDIVGSS
jgi:NAD(P)-dependent dehydrogenase (short-subunit alcohol dehydrogenase family)